jgi:hypothetical protein
MEQLGPVKSRFITEREDIARKEGHKEEKVSTVLRLMRRYMNVPADLEQAIRTCQDVSRLDAWLELASDRLPLEEFRKQVGV